MSEIIKERLKNSVGKDAELFTLNGFRFFGKIINSDEKYLEILDYKTDSYKIIILSEIKDLEIGK